MKTIKERIRKYLGVDTEVTYCLNKVLTVQQKIDVIYANIESMAESIKMRKDETVDNYHSINELENQLSYYSDYDLEEFDRGLRHNNDSLDALKSTVNVHSEKLSNIEEKLSYYNDYDLADFEGDIMHNGVMINELKHIIDTLSNRLDAFTTDTGEDSKHNNNVYIVDDIELLRPKIVSIVDDVINKYTVSVAASLRKLE